jgi:hypothetical protein
VKGKVKGMLIILFDIKGTIHTKKKIVLAGQRVSSANYCDILRRLAENLRRLRPELSRQKNWMLHHDNLPSHTSLFANAIFDNKQHNCRLPPTLFT